MNSIPRISVLMTVFNAGRHLDASVRSIVTQTFQDWEFLIVDDASTDGSAEVAESWAVKDKRIRLIRNGSNKGQTPCLNQGLREARGVWVARQDADDLSHPLRLTRQFERVTIKPELDLLGTCGRIIDGADRLCGLLDMPLTGGSIRWSAALLNPFLHTSVMFRRDVVLEEFGGYDESFRISQDYDLWLRLTARKKSANLPWRLVCYRNLSTALSKTGRETAYDEARRISERGETESFGRELSAGERRLIASFREGLNPADRQAFWNVYNGLLPSLTGPDRARMIAAHHLKVAGACGPGARCQEMVSAFRHDPAFAARWLIERWRG
jgi:hypothetical protein